MQCACVQSSMTCTMVVVDMCMQLLINYSFVCLSLSLNCSVSLSSPFSYLPLSLTYLPSLARLMSLLLSTILSHLHQPELVSFSTNPDRMLADNVLSQDQCNNLLELAKVLCVFTSYFLLNVCFHHVLYDTYM